MDVLSDATRQSAFGQKRPYEKPTSSVRGLALRGEIDGRAVVAIHIERHGCVLMYNLSVATVAREADRRPHPPGSVLSGLRVRTHADHPCPRQGHHPL